MDTSVCNKKLLSFVLSVEEIDLAPQGVGRGWVVGSQDFGKARRQPGLGRELEESFPGSQPVSRPGPKASCELHCLDSAGFDLLSKSGLEVAFPNYLHLL